MGGLCREVAEGRDEVVDVVWGVGGGEGEAESGLAFGDGGEADGGGEDACGAEGGGGVEGGGFGAEDDGDDGAGGEREVGEGGEEREIFVEPGAGGFAVGAGEEGGDDPCGGGGDGWGRGGGVDEGSGAVDEEVCEGAGAADEAAVEAGGFAEGSHVEVDAVGETEGVGETAAAWAEDAEAVGFVEEEESAVFVFEADDFGEGCGVAVHAEDAFGDDDDAGVGIGGAAGPEEEGFESGGVVVREDAEGCAAESSAVDEGSVAEFVEDEDVVARGDGG